VTPRVLVCDPSYPLERVREFLPDAEHGALADGGAGTRALLVSPPDPVTAADIAGLPDLQVIASASTGFDHIDVAAAGEAGVEVRTVDDYCTQEVADHAIVLVAALLLGIPAALLSVHRGEWDFRAGGTPRRLAGARLAVVGYGRIGRAVAERGRALGMEVRHHDPFLPGGEPDLDELLAWADAVTLHLALSDDTHGILDERRLGLMRPETALVNTARGPLVDREAMRRATHLRAAFDHVWEQPPGADLLGLPHLAITPYMAWFSADSEWLPYIRAAQAAADALADVSG
jgi:D-3-phosphoglycerate dehydrogenase / 2-oxoglutarate reductase